MIVILISVLLGSTLAAQGDDVANLRDRVRARYDILTLQDGVALVPRQPDANIRIIQSAAERMGLPMDKVFVNVDKYGNTSAGSIGMAMVEALEQGMIRPGSLIVTVGFGAGLTWGANVIRWNRDE